MTDRRLLVASGPPPPVERTPLPGELLLGRCAMVAFLAIFLDREVASLGDLTGPRRLGVVALTVVASLAWTWFWLVLAARPDGIWQGVAVVLVGVSMGVLVDINQIGLFPFYYAVIAAGAAYRWRIGVALVVGICALAVVVWWLTGHDGLSLLSLQNPLIIGGLGGASIVVRRYVAAQLELNTTRDQLRRIAALQARSQFARDLHDQLGQHLTTAVMQGELLSMDLAKSGDTQSKDSADLIVSTSREALTVMREMVTDVREPRMRTEAQVAQTLLAASGIGCEVVIPSADLAATTDAALGWLIREGTTNVMRHSGANLCRITVSQRGGQTVMEIADDGCGTVDSNVGNGLSHMRVRTEELGGTLEVTNGADGGYTLTARIPEPQ